MKTLSKLWGRLSGAPRIRQLKHQLDELYYSLRMAEDYGVEEDLFDEAERATGSTGSYPELEARWQKQTPGYQVGGGK